MAKTYPAKPTKGTRQQPLPLVLPVRVVFTADAYVARARGKSCSSTSTDAIAVRRLAAKLGYSTHADARFVRRGDEAGATHFEIVEVGHVAS